MEIKTGARINILQQKGYEVLEVGGTGFGAVIWVLCLWKKKIRILIHLSIKIDWIDQNRKGFLLFEKGKLERKSRYVL